MALQLKVALKASGCKLGVGAFKDLTRREFLKRFPRHTDADVYLDPKKDALFVGYVRAAAESPELPAYVINRTLEGLRKSGKLPQTRRQSSSLPGKTAQVHASKAAPKRARKPAPNAQPAAFA